MIDTFYSRGREYAWGGVEYPRKVTRYMSIYLSFARAILIYATCGLEMSKDKEYRDTSASGSLGLIT